MNIINRLFCDLDQFFKILIKDTVFERKMRNPYDSIESLKLFGTRNYVEEGLWPEEKLLYSSFEDKPGKALVIGCSAGRESIYLARKGWDVLGIDFIETLINIARNFAQEEGLKIEYKVFDILKIDESSFKNRKFDIIAFSIFPLIHPAGQRKRILGVLCNYLNMNGKILLIYQGRNSELKISNFILRKILKLFKRTYKEGDYICRINLLHVFSEEELKKEVEPQGFKVRAFSISDIYKFALLEKL